MKRTLTVALAVVFLLAIAAPVFASNMTYTQDFKADGDIQLERVAGHLCNTGAQWNQIIDGQGEITKVSSITMVEGKITVGDQNDFVTAIDAVRNLTVTSTIQLCAPPKKEYEITNYMYDKYLGVWQAKDGGSGVVGLGDYYATAHLTHPGWELANRIGPYDNAPSNFFSGNRTPAFGRLAGVTLAPGWEAGGWTQGLGGNYLGTVASTAWRSAVAASVATYVPPHNSIMWSPSPGSGNDMEATGKNLPSKYWPFTNAYVRGIEGAGVTLNPATGIITGHATAAAYAAALLAGEVTFAAARTVGNDVWSWGLADGLGYGLDLGVWGKNYSSVKITDLTDQIWSVQVEADPGFSGNLHQKFEAAYGPNEKWKSDGPPVMEGALDDPDIAPVHKKAWGWRTDSDAYSAVMVGDDYVGNYFTIEQMARTSQGTVKRNIDISSPWSHAYLSEQSEVVGFSEVQESFAMINLGPGADAEAEWWEIF